MKKINIAIDGPSGVGKSTIADIVAEKLNLSHLDTGAMYRCVAYKTLKDGVNIQDEKAMSDLMDTIDIHFDEDNHVYLDGEDVSKEIRMNNVSMQASKTSQLGIVRKKLVNLQQKVCANKGFIVDGRDICSVVLPDAEVKIFMSASSKARAQRRYDEYISKGIDADYETIYQDIVARDYQDMHREISPLVKTEDAIEIDTSDLTIDEVVSKVLDIVG